MDEVRIGIAGIGMAPAFVALFLYSLLPVVSNTLTGLTGVLVAKQLSGGVECLMGINRDPTFGPVAVFGLGGIFVELLNDVALRACPFGPEIAREMILSIRSAAVLQGARGQAVADIDALAQMLSRLSVFAAGAGERLVSVDLNPVLAMPEGQGAFALDAVIELDRQEAAALGH
jgi:acyl-CoA synthetase (NDP forming)